MNAVEALKRCDVDMVLRGDKIELSVIPLEPGTEIGTPDEVRGFWGILAKKLNMVVLSEPRCTRVGGTGEVTFPDEARQRLVLTRDALRQELAWFFEQASIPKVNYPEGGRGGETETT